MCSILIVKCSWDGLPEGRNCSCVWSFWCSELCSVDQTVTVQRGSVLDVIFPALLLSLDEYSSWRVGRVVPVIRSGVRTTLRSLLRSDLVAELNHTVIDVQRTDSMMELYQQLLRQVELPQLARSIQIHISSYIIYNYIWRALFQNAINAK